MKPTTEPATLTSASFEDLVREMIVRLGEDPDRDGLTRTQERLTTEIAETIQKTIQPQGVGVVIEARHLCMMMRGVEKQHSAAVTSSMLGCFREEQETRNEFLSLIRNRANGV